MTKHIEIIQKIVNKIEANLDQEMNVVELANAAGVSPWHFQRLFRSLIGDNLGSYLRGRRLTKAAQLLLETDQTILDVAVSVGFNSHEALTRSFKKQFNSSPKAFREDKPQVVLNKKPVLSSELISHLQDGMNLEPTILTRESFDVVGFKINIPSPFIPHDNYCMQLYGSWQELLERCEEIENRVPKTYLGLTMSQSGNFTEDEVEYIAGAKVSFCDKIPEGMIKYTLPEKKIAIFDIHDLDSDTAQKTIDYIYGYWLPNSNYERDQGHDYEYFENIVNFEDPGTTSKYVIPVK